MDWIRERKHKKINTKMVSQNASNPQQLIENRKINWIQTIISLE